MAAPNIPQAAPFMMVDSVTAQAAQLTILSDNVLLREDGKFSTAGIIEHMAQSIAALGNVADAKPQVGFIASVSKCNIFQNPPAGAILSTRVETIMSTAYSQVVKCSCKAAGQEVAEAQYSIFLQS